MFDNPIGPHVSSNEYRPILNKRALNLVSALQSCLVMVACLFVSQLLFGASVVPSTSMFPTLEVKEFLFFERLTQNFDYDDIILFNPEAADKDYYYVKRVIGLPGDTIEVKADGHLYRNGERLVAEYTNEATIDYTMPAVMVPEGEYFVMGDNRNKSNDSHLIGTIPQENCRGKVLFHVNPFGGSKTEAEQEAMSQIV